MKSFDMVMPKTVEEAVASLPEGEGSWEQGRVLAGGQDLVPELKDYVTSAEQLVNLKSIDAAARLHRVEVDAMGRDNTARLGRSIGALVTVAELEAMGREPGSWDSVLQEAAAGIASPQIRSVATVGGNLCQRPRCWYYRHESTPCLKRGGTECFSYEGKNKYNAILGGGPSYIVHPSDLAPALIALDAEVYVKGASASRRQSLEEFYTLPSEGDVTRETTLAPNEVLTGVWVENRQREWRSTYEKFKERSSFDWTLSAVALALKMQGDKIAEARLVLGGVAPRPWRCHSAEKLLVGRKPDDDAARAAGEEALKDAEPLSDNAYKVPLTKGLIVKAMRNLAR